MTLQGPAPYTGLLLNGGGSAAVCQGQPRMFRAKSFDEKSIFTL